MQELDPSHSERQQTAVQQAVDPNWQEDTVQIKPDPDAEQQQNAMGEEAVRMDHDVDEQHREGNNAVQDGAAAAAAEVEAAAGRQHGSIGTLYMFKRCDCASE